MPRSELPPIDARALKLLHDMHWCSTGWGTRLKGPPSTEEVEHAKRAGVLFDARVMDHTEIVRRARDAVAATDRRAVADAFVVSLLSRRLDLRSALGSFAIHQHMPVHACKSDMPEHYYCEVCSTYIDDNPKKVDMNVLNFERHKWGGVRHSHPEYAGFDLELFSKLPRVRPDRDDVRALRMLLDSAVTAPARITSGALHKYIPRELPSNKQERDVLIQILGYCGILGTNEYPGFTTKFIRHADRTERFVEMAYPVCWWRGGDGLQTHAVKYWFGHLLK